MKILPPEILASIEQETAIEHKVHIFLLEVLCFLMLLMPGGL
jgi:hypothetical protein